MMRKRFKARVLIRRTILWGGLLALLFLGLNIFLTGRLERYLKKELIERTRLATDGFYRLSFEKLSVSFFNGELKLEGISLQPDSAVFHRWAAVDSLPQTYISTRIGLIDFKGINLTWRWNYRRLHFNTFVIKSPKIQVFNVLSSSREVPQAKYEKTKTLYETIAPYIDVLSVRTLNLENASIAYQVQGEVSPITYSLDNVSFHAYDFRLDSASYRSGNLLYCQNFDFVTNQPQTLLISNDFTLKTDSIRLSTEDSMIYIRNIKLEPQEVLWEKTDRRPSSYLLGRIKTVDVKGIRFDRKEALNYLTARSFNIVSSSVSLYDLTDRGDSQDESLVNVRQKVLNTDSLVQALSLYDVISPVLHSVSVNEITIERTGLMYSKGQKSKTEVYSIPELNFQANGFLIDSLVEPGQELQYFQSIQFEAKNIQGILRPRNHRFDIKHLTMNTATGHFQMDSLRLRPLSTNSRKDYMSASIDGIRLEGLAYDKGISADRFTIQSPRLRYYKVPSIPSSVTNKEGHPANSRVDVENLLNPFLQYLSIRKISIKNAYASLTDRTFSDTAVYRLNDFHFFADDFLVDERTNRMNRFAFSYKNFGFSFRDFDNTVAGGKYHVSIKRAEFSTRDSLFRLKQVTLNSTDQGLSFTSPQIHLTGIRLPQNRFTDQLVAGNIYVTTPAFEWTKANGIHLSTAMESLELKGMSYDSLSVIMSKELSVSQGQFSYSWKSDSTILRTESQRNINLVVDHASFNLKDKDFQFADIQLQTNNIQIPLDNGFYLLKVGNLNLAKSGLWLNHVHLVSPYPKMEFAYKQPEHQDWFDVKVGSVALTNIDWPSYWKDGLVHIGGLWIKNVLLQNLKNRKIPVTPHLVPMIYEGLQKAPIRLRIDTADISDFSVVYEELPLKGEKPGKLYFTDMNGRFSGLTNIVSYPDQYMTLHADGKLMGSGYFKATWKLPVDSLHDRFLLEGHLDKLNLVTLNEIVTPLAPAKVLSGFTHDVSFSMDASSKGGRIQLDFPYKNLKVAVLKDKNGDLVQTGFLSRLANLVLRHDNPSHPEKTESKLRHVDITVERDPYHSTFNYLWQLLRPALIESVGVSKREQDTVKKVSGFFTKVKKFLGVGKRKEQVSTEELNIESSN